MDRRGVPTLPRKGSPVPLGEVETGRPGSTTIATLHAPVPGPIKLVDHALSRVARKGALAVLDVEGPEDHGIFDPEPR